MGVGRSAIADLVPVIITVQGGFGRRSVRRDGIHAHGGSTEDCASHGMLEHSKQESVAKVETVAKAAEGTKDPDQNMKETDAQGLQNGEREE